MKRRPSVPALAALWAASIVFGSLTLDVGGSTADAQGKDRRGRPEKRAKKEPKKIFAVVRVGTEFRVVEKGEIKNLKREIADKNKRAKQDWGQAKKAARKAKEKFTEKAPKALTVKVVKSGFKSEQAASAFRDKAAAKGPKSGAHGFVVVAIDAEVKVMPRAEFAALQKRAAGNYKAAMAVWLKAKRGAAKAKRPFEEEKPRRSAMKRLGGVFKTQALAEGFRTKHLAKKKALADKKAGVKPDKKTSIRPEPKPAKKTG